MKVVRSGLLVGALVSSAGLAAFALVAACSNSDNENVAPGGECFSASDCQPGLICIPVKGSDSRVCSGDLTGLTGNPEDMPDSTMREATVLDSPPFDAPTTEDTGTADTSTPDTGPKDAATDG